VSAPSGAARTQVAPAIRGAGAVLLVSAVGFGVGAVWSLAYLGRHGELPMTPFGFRAFSGPFETLGTVGFTALGWVFVGVCALESLAGVWLWQGRRRGATVGLATTPLALLLGMGFALPFYLVSIPIWLGLLAMGRRTLRDATGRPST
jgi:hypothetical protein